jgi:hypothetical protein
MGTKQSFVCCLANPHSIIIVNESKKLMTTEFEVLSQAVTPNETVDVYQDAGNDE